MNAHGAEIAAEALLHLEPGALVERRPGRSEHVIDDEWNICQWRPVHGFALQAIFNSTAAFARFVLDVWRHACRRRLGVGRFGLASLSLLKLFFPFAFRAFA